MEGNEQAYDTGQDTILGVEKVLEMFSSDIPEDRFTSSAVKTPTEFRKFAMIPGGNIYIYKVTDTDSTPWKDDGLNWKLTETRVINKRPKITQRSHCLVKNGVNISDCKKAEYSKESGHRVLVHYLGDFTQHLDTEGNEASQGTERMDTQESVSADTTTTDTGPSTNTAPQPTLTHADPPNPAPDSSTSEPDLASAMKMMKAALAAKQNTKPEVLDVFNKFMESVKDDDVDLCLVVNNRKSGASSVVGSPDIASTRRSSRKRTAAKFDSDEEEEITEKKSKPETSKPKPETSKPAPEKSGEANEYELKQYNGKIIQFPQPQKENFFSFSIVSDEEKTIHADFFAQSKKSTKTEERYLKIRNYIITLWQQKKPVYVSKSEIRKGLTDCGDVTCMSRIHQYLVCKGVINFNSEKVTPQRVYVTPKRRKIVEVSESEDEDDSGEEDVNQSDSDYSASEDSQTRVKRQTPKPRKSATADSGPKEKKAKSTPRTEPRKKTERSSSRSTSKSADESNRNSNFSREISLETPVRSSGRSRRNIATPNWADILSGKKSFKADGAIIIKKEKADSDGEIEFADDDEVENARKETDKGKRQNETSRVKNVKTEAGLNKVSRRDGEKSTEPDSSQDVIKLDGTSSVDDPPEDPDADQEVVFQSGEARKKQKTVYKFSCSVCNKSYSSEILLEQHMSFVHSESGKQPAIVTLSGGDKGTQAEIIDGDDDDDYADDVVEVSEEEAEISDEDFDEEEFKSAVKKTKPKRQRVKFNATFIKGKPTCDICGIQFLTVGNLRKHHLLHTNKMYECPFCAKLMKRKDYVNSHVKKMHKEVDLDKNPIDFDNYTHEYKNDDVTGDGEVETEAELMKEIEDKTDELEGMKADTGLGKKVCPECHKLYDNQEDLEQHVILVHNKDLKDALYTCQACNKQCKSLVSYQVHKLSHRKRAFVCQHCDERFSTNSQLQVHKRRDHQIQFSALMYFGYLLKDGKVTCEICSISFKSMEEYLDHRPEHLTFEHLCRKCGNGFDTEEDLQRHLASNCTEVNLHLPCGVCSSKFFMNDTRRKHIQANHPKSTDIYCHHCALCFDEMEQLRAHFPVHQKERVFICELCEKTFFEKRNLVDHRELHRSSKNFQCDICHRFYISSKSLQRHIKLHLAQNTKACKHCEQKFASQEDVMRHMKNEHLEEHLKDQTRESVHQVACPKCNKVFLSNMKLARHMQLHPDDPASSYLCVHCDTVFDSKELPLWKHMEESHPDIKEGVPVSRKDYSCGICGYSTAHKQRLERHMETHNPDKQFVCKYCNKCYQTTSSLMTHMISHRGKIRKGAKPQPKCTWPGCEKQFMKQSLYKRHLLSHIYKVKTGRDLCECGKCQYSASMGRQYVLTGESGDVSAVGFVDNDGNSHVAFNVKKKTAEDGSETILQVNVNTGQTENYQSMEILHEAIAQIEDIEKNPDPPTVPTPTEDGKGGDVDSEVMEGTVEADNTIIISKGMGEPRLDQGVGITYDDMMGQIEADDNAVEEINEPATLSELVESSTVEEVGEMTAEGTNNTGDEAVEAGQEVESGGDQQQMEGLGNQQQMESSGNRQQMVNAGNQTVLDDDDDDDEEPIEVIPTNPPSTNAASEFITAGMSELNGSANNRGNGILVAEDAEPSNEIMMFNMFECAVCDQTFPHKCQVLGHLESTHESHKFPHCEVCKKCMIDKKNLTDHMVIHDTFRKFSCETCGRRFRTKQCLRQHLYIHAEVKPFQCEHCGHGFTQRGFYEEHLRRHLGVRPYKCAMCGKGFVSKSMLKVHMYSHTGIRPYHCPYCPKTFSENYHLQNHVRNHIDHRPFQCSRCPKAFCVKPKLIRHLHTVHGIQKERISSYYPTKVGEGIGYRDRKKNKPKDETKRTTQVVYIDAHGNIVKQEMKDIEEAEYEEKDEEEGKEENIPEEVQVEVVTHRDADGNIQTIVPPQFIPESLISIPEDGESENVVYQEIHTDGTAIENTSIQLDGQNYTLVTADGQGEGHLQLITHALAGVQSSAKQEEGQIQVITQEVANMEELGVEGAENIQVIEGELPEGAQAEDVQKFSINIQEDGTVNASDIEALRNLYNDQQIVIVLENQQQ